jgi:prepilin-type N-terminal cleavage/methylation domain-containing protein
MSARGYSLVEVMVAAAIVAVGLTAAAVMVGTLMQQQELNAATLRAANLQEQAVKLYRLDLSPGDLVSLLPETSRLGTPQAAGEFGFIFSRALKTNIVVDPAATISLDRTGCDMVYDDPLGAGGFVTNSVTILRPSVRVIYQQ